MLHLVLQAAILLPQLQNLLLQHLVLMAFLLISSEPIGAKNYVIAQSKSDHNSYHSGHPAARTRKIE